ncbi:MAG: aminodeoxychorismate synthase component I [Sterolibacterium sp.]|nr:aminodeoxychorismate synthase component I [Sterolibacterium sp.]
MSPLLLFDFPLAHDATGQPLRQLLAFSQPRQLLCATRLADVKAVLQAAEAQAQAGDWVVGYVAYDAAPAFDPALRVPHVSHASQTSPSLPLLWFGVFDQPLDEARTQQLADSLASSRSAVAEAPWQANRDARQFAAEMARIRQHIHAGDVYQINHTLRLKNTTPDSALAWFAHLRHTQPDAYLACLDIGPPGQIISASPELFFRRTGEHITTQPMKGTTRRGRWAAEDRQQAAWLQASEKNRAENLMIVDLLRNDLSRIALPHSVQVSQLFALEAHPTLWQMTSTIQATARPGTTLADIFSALFPCGSITGAPKTKAMELIATLEDEPRGIYCGAIGLLQPGGDAVFNVAIRTLQLQAEKLTCGAGSGIIWESQATEEYAEILLKTRFLETAPARTFSLFETLRLENGRYWLLERHLTRLSESAACFNYPCDLAACRHKLAELAGQHIQGNWRVRLDLNKSGEIHTQCTPLPATPARPSFVLADDAVVRTSWWLHHKTSQRQFFEAALRNAQSQQADVFDVLFHNEAGELTEFSRGNLVLEIAGQHYTPPQDCGLLAGVLRAELLASGQLQERTLTLADLARAERIFFINSLRGCIEIRQAGTDTNATNTPQATSA